MNFELGSPYFLILLFLIICLIWCKPLVKKFYFAKLEWLKTSHPFTNIELWLKIVAFSLLVFAMSQPFTYDSKVNNNKKGRDLVLAIDASGSMGQSGFHKEDRFKTKFDINLELVTDFMKNRFDDNIGAVIFGTFAYTTSPITYDTEALEYILKMVNVGIAGQSTAIGDAIDQSLQTLKKSHAQNKVIILLTDGYHNAGKYSPKVAVAKARKANVKIYTIGIGEKSNYDSALLEEIAMQTGAKSFNASTAKELKKIYSTIDTLEPSPIKSENYLNRKLLISYPLVLALIVLILIYVRSQKTLMHNSINFIIILLVLIAIYRPTTQKELQENLISSNNIIIALDASYSMQAKDIQPSRYEFSKQTIREFLTLNPKDNVMLIAFTSNPLLLSPPTTDHNILNIALNSLNTNNILTKGTSLKNLLHKINQLNSFNSNLILITDGGEVNNIDEIETLLLNKNLNLITLAVGTKEGTTIDKLDGSKIIDNEGNLIISRLNPTLKTLTNNLKGQYIESSTPQDSASKLTNALENNMLQHNKEIFIAKELYQIPLMLAIILFLILHTKAIKYLVILFALFGTTSNATIIDNLYIQNAYKSYEQKDYSKALKNISKIESSSLHKTILRANTYYKNQNFNKAITQYKSIKSTNKDIKLLLFYNIANSYMKLNNYKNAIIYYTKALNIYSDEDTLYNLSLAIKKRDEHAASTGIAHPKSQSGKTSKSESSSENKKNNEDTPSSGSGGAGESSSGENIKKDSLLDSGEVEQMPLSSKVYELINKGYIREKQPW